MIDPKKIWNSSQLPTLPTVAIELLELAKNETTEISDVVAAIQTDPAISAKILKAANSSFFGLRSKVTSLDRAVPLLGTTVVTSLALSFSLVDTSMQKGKLAEFYNAYWKQSLVQASVSESLARKYYPRMQGEYFLAGLLIDLGQLAMLKTISEEYITVIQECKDQGKPLCHSELVSLGINHAQVGAELMKRWSLPEEISKSAEIHHLPFEEIQKLEFESDDEKNLIQAAAVSSAMGDYFCTNLKGESVELLKELTSNYYSYSMDELNDFIEEVRVRVDEAAELFSVDVSDIGDPSDLMAEANEQLAMIAMKEHVASAQAEARTELMEREKQQLESKNEELKQQAFRDPLTKLYNRNFFSESLNNELHRCCREANSIGIIFSDIDKFKNLNDTYGHQFGDQVLVTVSKLIQDTLRKCDVVARFGGEEFVILVQQPTEQGIAKIAERLREKIESLEICFEGKPVPITSSFGTVISIPKPNEVEIGEFLIAQADEAMYDSKQNGRNQVHNRSMISKEESELHNLVNQMKFSRWLVSKGELDIKSASKALLRCEFEYLRMGDLALLKGFLTEEQIEQITTEKSNSSERMGEIAIRLGLMNRNQLALLLAHQKEMPKVFLKSLLELGLIDPQKVVDLFKTYSQEMNSLALTNSAPCEV